MKPKVVSTMSLSSNRPRSLNQSFRKKEITRIMGENLALFNRLQVKNSHYSVKKWNKEHKEKTKLLQHMRNHPFNKTPNE